MQYDVFNGDADGIMALHQLRLREPKSEAVLVTGVKRDIGLLRKIDNAVDSSITVVDVSLDKNRTELARLLENNNRVRYIDHHYAGNIPAFDALEHHIEPSPHTCSSIIVNTLLDNQYPAWAACGAFGDNLNEQAEEIALGAGMTSEQKDILQEIGELFNYNGYGTTIEDLHYHPADLYRAVRPFADPLDFYASTDIVRILRDGFAEDIAMAEGQKNILPDQPHRIYHLPAAPWARRIAGVFSNRKARERREAAHAIIVDNGDTTFQVSVRAPLNDKKNADELCRHFPSGGGRAGAAGINHLPADMFDGFIEAFLSMYNRD